MNTKPHPITDSYKMLLHEFVQITIVPYGEMLEITDRPARLKVEV